MKIQTISENLAKGSLVLQRERTTKILNSAKRALLIWIAVFLISEIAISGGRYEFNFYLTVIQLIIILTILIYFISRSKTKPKSFKDALFVGLSLAISFAVLDFLIINLLLEKNSLLIYKNWGTYAQYALLIIVPMAQPWFKNRPQSLVPPPPPEGEIEAKKELL